MILTAGAQVIEHVLIRGFIYAVEGAVSLTWSGAKYVYQYVSPEKTETQETINAASNNEDMQDMQYEIIKLKKEIQSIKTKMKTD